MRLAYCPVCGLSILEDGGCENSFSCWCCQKFFMIFDVFETAEKMECAPSQVIRGRLVPCLPNGLAPKVETGKAVSK